MAQFRTKDLSQAAFIWSQPNARLITLEPIGEKHSFTVYFLFETGLNDAELSDLMINYANGETTVEPNKFCEKQTRLRDFLHNCIGVNRGKN